MLDVLFLLAAAVVVFGTFGVWGVLLWAYAEWRIRRGLREAENRGRLKPPRE